MEQFATQLLSWFDQHGRKDLPWQQALSHYRVWVSEIMLQQTQVKTVIPYFNRFMESFPSIEALADAPLSQVLAHWSGLGYYARARNLHKAAQMIVTTHQRIFPRTLDAVSALPGIGRSTASAILAIVDNQPLAILDGNVKRVLARVHAIDRYPGEKSTEQKLWHLAQSLMPTARANHYTQAIMDLGATLCTRSKPRCLECPVQTLCQAYQQGEATRYPVPKPRKATRQQEAHFLLLQHQHDILLEQRPESGIWGGLLALPSFNSFEALQTWLNTHLPQSQFTAWPKRKHVFTHFTLHFTPIEVSSPSKIHPSDAHVWHPINQDLKLGLPAPIKRLLNDYYQVKYGKNDLL